MKCYIFMNHEQKPYAVTNDKKIMKQHLLEMRNYNIRCSSVVVNMTNEQYEQYDEVHLRETRYVSYSDGWGVCINNFTYISEKMIYDFEMNFVHWFFGYVESGRDAISKIIKNVKLDHEHSVMMTCIESIFDDICELHDVECGIIHDYMHIMRPREMLNIMMECQSDEKHY